MENRFLSECKLDSGRWRVQRQTTPLLISILCTFLTWMRLTVGFKHQVEFRVAADVHSRPLRCSRWCIQELPECSASYLCKRIDSPAHPCSLKCKEEVAKPTFHSAGLLIEISSLGFYWLLWLLRSFTLIGSWVSVLIFE